MADLTLAQALAKRDTLPSVILAYGSDSELVDSGARALLADAKARIGNAVVAELTQTALLQDPARLLDLAATRSLFDDPEVLVVADLTERGAAIVIDFLESLSAPLENAAVLLASSTLRARSSLVGKMRQSPFAVCVTCYDSGIDRRTLRARLSDHGIRAADASVEDQLLEAFENADLGRIERSLDKLALYLGPSEPLTAEAIEACIELGEPAGLDLLSAALLSGDRDALLADITARLRLGEDPAQVTLLFSRVLSDLSAGAAALDGEGGRKPFWKLEKTLQAARRRTPDLRLRLERGLTAIHDFERRLRSSPALPEIELERLALALSVTLSSGRSR